MTATITPLNVLPLAAAPVGAEAPVTNLPAVITRPRADEIVRTRTQIEALSKVGYEVRTFEHTKSLARHWWAPVTLGVLGTAAAMFSVEAAVLIAGSGAAIGGAMRAWLPVATRRAQAEEVKVAQSLETVSADEKNVALSPSDISAATRAALVIADMQTSKINDPKTLARLQAIVDRAAPASDAEKARAKAWEVVLDAGKTYYDRDSSKRFLDALGSLSVEDRAALVPVVYDQLFVSSSHNHFDHETISQLFGTFRAELGNPYPVSAEGPAPNGLDSKDVVIGAVRQFAKLIDGKWSRDTLSAEALTKLAAGAPAENVAADFTAFAYVLSPERTNLERAVFGELTNRVNRYNMIRTFETQAGFEAIELMGAAQPADVRNEAVRILNAFNTLSDGALEHGTRDLRPALRMFDKLEAANELGLRELFALR